jgi:hypothetical protein
MALTVNQHYGNQCMVGATKLLFIKINNLRIKTRFKSGKAATQTGIIATL